MAVKVALSGFGQLMRTVKYIAKLTEKPQGKADPRKTSPVPAGKISGAPGAKKKNGGRKNTPLPRKPSSVSFRVR